MHWPTLQRWLAIVRRVRLIAAATWAVISVLMGVVWWWTGNALVGIALAAFALVAVLVLAVLEVLHDYVAGRLDDQDVAEFGRRRFAEVNRAFPRPEGIDALAKDKQVKAARFGVPKPWKLPRVSEQSLAAYKAGADSDASGDGGADGEEPEEDFS